MTRRGSADVGFFLYDGYNILGTVTEVNTQKERILEDDTTLGDGDEEWAPVGEMRRAMITQRGFFDDAANSVHAALIRFASTGVLALGMEGNTLAQQFLGYAGALTAKYRRIPSKAAQHKAEADYQVSGAVEEGIILHPLGAETAAPFAGTSVNHGSTTSNGLAGYLQVPSITLGGYTSATVKIRHSDDNVIWADLITFTVVSAAPTAERKAVVGSVLKWLRVEVTWQGAGSGQSITFMAGAGRGGVNGNRAL